MEILEVKEKKVWEDFLSGCKEKTFLQSWNWGEFNKRMFERIWRLGVFVNDSLVSCALVVKVKAKRGTFLLLPHGPITISNLKAQRSKILKAILKKLKEITKEEKASSIKIAPVWERNEENHEIFKNLGFRKAPIHIHPELTWVLDITSSEKEILMQMRKTTRYLIRQGLKNKDLKIFQSQDLKDLEVFNKLYQETVKRHHFIPFSLDYLRNEFLSFLPDNQIVLFIGKYKNEVLASAVVVFWQGIAFYHHGASLLKHPKIPVSYLLQWEAIREAKRRDCYLYNFWGVVSTGEKSHPWAGLTLFKKGFGGREKKYVKTQDLPLSWRYWPTYFFEKLRKKKRGF